MSFSLLIEENFLRILKRCKSYRVVLIKIKIPEKISLNREIHKIDVREKEKFLNSISLNREIRKRKSSLNTCSTVFKSHYYFYSQQNGLLRKLFHSI